MTDVTRMWLIASLVAALAGPATAQDEPLRVAKLMTVGSDAAGVTRQFFGQVVARQTVDLAFQVSGQIVRFPADEGARISQGSLIAQLDLEPFELQLQQAQLQADQAGRALERMTQLAGSVSEASREDAATSFSLAKVAVRNAEVALENATLQAPFDALVASRNVANFTTTSAGTPVVRLHDMSELRVEIDVPEVLFQRAGENADLELLARFPSRTETYPLEIREFNAEASAVGQTFRLTLGMERPSDLAVLPGSSVTVLATINAGQPRLLVPATAIRIANDGSTSVLVFSPTDEGVGVLEQVGIDIEPTRDGQFSVVSGLDAGTEIVRIGAQALADGQMVRRFTGFSN
jgi:RND family efflux transporter MFP subunit